MTVGLAAVAFLPMVALTSLMTTLTPTAPPRLRPSLVMSLLPSVAAVLPLCADALPKMAASAMSGFDRMSLYLVGLNLPPTSGLALLRVSDVSVAWTPTPLVLGLADSVWSRPLPPLVRSMALTALTSVGSSTRRMGVLSTLTTY